MDIGRADFQDPRSARGLAIAVALRPHHWAKNLLVFLPILAAHRFAPDALARAIGAFVCFCAVASAGYLFNDLLDAAVDRAHPRKKGRAIASGEFPTVAALMLGVFLGALGVSGAWLLSPAFCAVIAIYLATSVLYSLALKRAPIVDVVALAAMFALRVVGGGEATATRLSNWLLMFSMFLFLALAIAKRCSETASIGAGEGSFAGRPYRSADLPFLSGLGAAAGYASALVLALYIGSPEVRLLYAHPDRLWWAIPFLIYWISRMLLFAGRGSLQDDPLVFALRDRVTWIVAACVGLVGVWSA